MKVSSSLVIPEAELSETFTTSGGPGGQHANRSATRVELTWNVDRSAVLSEAQRRRLRGRLKERIDRDGDLRVIAGDYRSQHRNREQARKRLVRLVGDALEPRPKRRPTRPTKAARERRLDAKKRRGDVKRLRRDPDL